MGVDMTTQNMSEEEESTGNQDMSKEGMSNQRASQ